MILVFIFLFGMFAGVVSVLLWTELKLRKLHKKLNDDFTRKFL